MKILFCLLSYYNFLLSDLVFSRPRSRELKQSEQCCNKHQLKTKLLETWWHCMLSLMIIISSNTVICVLVMSSRSFSFSHCLLIILLLNFLTSLFSRWTLFCWIQIFRDWRCSSKADLTIRFRELSKSSCTVTNIN